MNDDTGTDGRFESALRRWRVWAAIVGGWTVEALVSVGQYRSMTEAAGSTVVWTDALAVSLGSAWLWIPPTAFAIWSSERFPLRRERPLPAFGVHLGGLAGVIVFRAVAVVALNPWVGWYAELPGVRELLVTSFFNNVVVYLLLVGVGHAVHFARATRMRERELEDARLRTLRSQLQPHFLFNTLNTIASFVRDEPLKAERMIARLSAMLRSSLHRASAQEVPLREELDLLEPYLEIERMRFEDRLRIEVDAEPAVLSARVPSLMLQPLVENAVRHGVARRTGSGRVAIHARREHDRLRIEVRDDGVGLEPADGERSGIGLANIRARLRRLYGERQSFTLEDASGSDGGVVATVELPLVTDEEPIVGGGAAVATGFSGAPDADG